MMIERESTIIKELLDQSLVDLYMNEVHRWCIDFLRRKVH